MGWISTRLRNRPGIPSGGRFLLLWKTPSQWGRLLLLWRTPSYAVLATRRRIGAFRSPQCCHFGCHIGCHICCHFGCNILTSKRQGSCCHSMSPLSFSAVSCIRPRLAPPRLADTREGRRSTPPTASKDRAPSMSQRASRPNPTFPTRTRPDTGVPRYDVVLGLISSHSWTQMGINGIEFWAHGLLPRKPLTEGRGQ